MRTEEITKEEYEEKQKARLFRKQLKERFARLSIEEVADQLEQNIEVKRAMRARLLEFLRAHDEQVCKDLPYRKLHRYSTDLVDSRLAYLARKYKDLK